MKPRLRDCNNLSFKFYCGRCFCHDRFLYETPSKILELWEFQLSLRLVVTAMSVLYEKVASKVTSAEPPVAGLTGTLGTKGGGFLPFQALRSTDSV